MKNADPLKAPGVPDYSATRSLGMDRQSSPAAPGLCPGEDKFSLLHNHLILEKFAAFFIRDNENLVYSITFKIDVCFVGLTDIIVDFGILTCFPNLPGCR
ncbi:MAG: hypothetical protein MUO67_11765 [Anaerolineales bacterium]|nr:hypothetical protein [Anaerolineales bacterium]